METVEYGILEYTVLRTSSKLETSRYAREKLARGREVELGKSNLHGSFLCKEQSRSNNFGTVAAGAGNRKKNKKRTTEHFYVFFSTVL